MNDCFLKLFLDKICALLETYSGRDKVLRTLCYSTKLIGGIHSNKALSDKFLMFSKHMSATRTTLRLLDDLPMLKCNLEYGFGKQEPDKFMSTIGFTANIIDQIYYPIEKIAWLAEHNFISGVNESKFDVACSICWVVSIQLSLIKSLHVLFMLHKHKLFSNKNKDISVKYNKFKGMEKYEMLTSIRLLLNLVHAINTLPRGFLWSSKLNNWQVGLIATISSVLGIYQVFAKKSLIKQRTE